VAKKMENFELLNCCNKLSDTLIRASLKINNQQQTEKPVRMLFGGEVG